MAEIPLLCRYSMGKFLAVPVTKGSVPEKSSISKPSCYWELFQDPNLSNILVSK